MQRKGKLWMADWRDENGKRHRKGFTSRTQAAKHQAQKEQETKLKKANAPT